MQISCVHLLGEYSKLIRFQAMLAKCLPYSGHKVGENGSFRPLSEKVFTQSNSKLVCTLTGRELRIDSPLDHVGQILAL